MVIGIFYTIYYRFIVVAFSISMFVLCVCLCMFVCAYDSCPSYTLSLRVEKEGLWCLIFIYTEFVYLFGWLVGCWLILLVGFVVYSSFTSCTKI